MAREQGNRLSLETYRRMQRIRQFEAAAVDLLARGELSGGLHTMPGQEAAIVGACMALDESDYMVGTHRSHGHPIGKGARLDRLMAELMGRATGVNQGKGGSMHLSDFSVGSLGETSIVGSGLPIATGAALGSKMQKNGRVALCFFGDGASSEGTFHESLNIASIWKLPVIYFCENNGYAISTPASQTVSVADIAQRAAGYSMPGHVVDGQDVMAAMDVTATAVARARAGEGPTLIEAKTYRFEEHAIGLQLNYLTALRDAMAEVMRRDERVFVMGEDLRHNLYGSSAGLLDEFGPDRVLDVPLAEAGVVGTTIGAAMVGMRPVVDITIAPFLYPACDQIVSIAAKSRYIYGGQTCVPIVIRACMFYNGGSAAQHSDRPYAMFMGIPGLKIVVPSDDGGDVVLPLGKAAVKREGTDVTLFAVGGAVTLAQAAAKILEAEGISVEIVDPRTAKPLDVETVLASVRKTGRFVAVDPAHRTGSLASEIVASVSERLFGCLKAAPIRVCTPDTHIPFAPNMEKGLYPTTETIAAAVRHVMKGRE